MKWNIERQQFLYTIQFKLPCGICLTTLFFAIIVNQKRCPIHQRKKQEITYDYFDRKREKTTLDSTYCFSLIKWKSLTHCVCQAIRLDKLIIFYSYNIWHVVLRNTNIPPHQRKTTHSDNSLEVYVESGTKVVTNRVDLKPRL